ncbi:baseplate J/gp47 family protein [Phreatobacter stygius]|uniref:Uncharacterized protein n=1 Tax=Phreatobacter stygius TaxID=1940610 RepID=A0A4D7AUY0_9HYPH|nr:baseplate J/gp47 family protein [Phreatobacter stygius]QCI65534.1 hypothetical protein E8M01_15760 [Phreatobacter stygius]
MIPVSPRATPIDLTLLAPPTIIDPIDPDRLVLDWIADLKRRLPEWTGVFDQDPFVKACHVWAYALANKLARDNKRCEAVLLATSSGADLDQIAATYYADLGVRRLVVTAGDADAVPPVAPVMESDDRFRDRIRLAPEAYAGTGTEGGYRYWALTAVPRLMDAGLGVSDDLDRRLTLIALPPDDLDPAAVSLAILDEVRKHKPLTDVVSVGIARPMAYRIKGVLQHGAGADPAMLRQIAVERCRAVADHASAHVGEIVGTDALIAAMRVPGVTRCLLEEPLQHFDPGFDGVARAVSIDIRTERRDG